MQAVEAEAAPFHEGIAQARARQSEPAAERDLLTQQQATAGRRYEVDPPLITHPTFQRCIAAIYPSGLADSAAGNSCPAH